MFPRCSPTEGFLSVESTTLIKVDFGIIIKKYLLPSKTEANLKLPLKEHDLELIRKSSVVLSH